MGSHLTEPLQALSGRGRSAAAPSGLTKTHGLVGGMLRKWSLAVVSALAAAPALAHDTGKFHVHAPQVVKNAKWIHDPVLTAVLLLMFAGFLWCVYILIRDAIRERRWDRDRKRKRTAAGQ